jgi:hypothetical protein
VSIPVGAALIARDNVVALVGRYDTRDKVERELRARRGRIEADLRLFELRGATARREAAAQANLVGSRAQSLVQSGITVGAQAAAKAVERLARVG